MNKHLIDSIIPGNIYTLYFKNGKNIILKITDVIRGNGSVGGYDCFGMPTVLCIHGIYGFVKISSFPRLSTDVKQNDEIQDVDVEHKSNKSCGDIPLESVRVIEPDSLLDIKVETSEDVDLIQENKNSLRSVDYPIINNHQPNDNLLSNKKHDSIIAKERNALLSLKIVSINGNAIIENSGGTSVD